MCLSCFTSLRASALLLKGSAALGVRGRKKKCLIQFPTQSLRARTGSKHGPSGTKEKLNFSPLSQRQFTFARGMFGGGFRLAKCPLPTSGGIFVQAGLTCISRPLAVMLRIIEPRGGGAGGGKCVSVCCCHV